jgi:hypothetical protein
MKISPVVDRDGLAEFVEFPRTIYADDPSWVPPLREQVYRELTDHSAFARYARKQLFVCEDEGRIAGRIAALVNPRLVSATGEVMGQLGYFECVNDASIASALVDAGIDWLRAQHVKHVIGPMNGGAHRAHRLMTRGFDRPPYLFEPRNPAYYPRLFERCGFVPVGRWYGYEMNRHGAIEQLARLERILGRRPAPVRIEELQTGQSQETMVRVHRVLDRCWAGHVGYASLDLDEFVEVFGGALSIMDPGQVAAFVQDGEDAGFAFVYPDYVDDVRALDGSAGKWGHWLGTSRPNRIVLSTAALVPAARHSTAATAQVAWAFRQAVSGEFDECVLSLVIEGFLSRIEEPTREHTLYARAIGA